MFVVILDTISCALQIYNSLEQQKERCMDKLAMANGVEHITTMHRKARDGK